MCKSIKECGAFPIHFLPIMKSYKYSLILTLSVLFRTSEFIGLDLVCHAFSKRTEKARIGELVMTLFMFFIHVIGKVHRQLMVHVESALQSVVSHKQINVL